MNSTRIDRPKFLALLDKIKPFIPRSSYLPILSCIRIETASDSLICIHATNLDDYVSGTFKCRNEGEYSLVMDFKQLYCVLKRLKENEVSFTYLDKTLTVCSGRNTIRFENLLDADDFPVEPTDEITNSFGFPPGFMHSVKKAAAFVGDDRRRTVLTGIKFEIGANGCTVVATDGKRLFFTENELPCAKNDAVEFIVRPFFLKEMIKNKAERIFVTAGFVMLEVGDLRIRSKLIDEKYPDFRQVVPTEYKGRVLVDRKRLIGSNKLLLGFTDTSTKKIVYAFGKDGLLMEAYSAEKGTSAKDKLDVCYDSKIEEIRIGFNGAYMNDILRKIDSDEVAFEFSSPNSGMIIRPVSDKKSSKRKGLFFDEECGNKETYLFMPLRLED